MWLVVSLLWLLPALGKGLSVRPSLALQSALQIQDIALTGLPMPALGVDKGAVAVQ